MNFSKNNLLMDKINLFFENETNKTVLINILNNKYNVSLRIIDWFVTNYCKKYNIYWVEDNQRFVVYLNYKLQLKAYSKKRFDPFCRWDRIRIPYNNNQSMETTIGQLNFFKWAIENNIIDYIQSHFQEIEQDMNNFNSTAKRRTITEPQNDNAKTRKKREELSVSACKCIKKETVKIIVKFD